MQLIAAVVHTIRTRPLRKFARLACIVIGVLLASAFVGTVVTLRSRPTDKPFLSFWDFTVRAASRRVDNDTGYLIPFRSKCNEFWQTKGGFVECSAPILRGGMPSRLGVFDPSAAAASRGGASRGASGAGSSARGGSDSSKRSPTTKTAATTNTSTSLSEICRNNRDPHNPDCPVLWITYITRCTFSSNRFGDVLSEAGIPLAVLGLGTLWKGRWGLRVRALHDFLVSLPDDKLIVWSDADDVLPVPSITVEGILERYNRLVDFYNGPRVFFGAETVCYPAGHLWYNYTDPSSIPGAPGHTPFRYLNAGTMVGPAGLVRRMLALVYQEDCFDDQLLFTLAHLDPVVWWRDPSSNELLVASKRNEPPAIRQTHVIDTIIDWLTHDGLVPSIVHFNGTYRQAPELPHPTRAIPQPLIGLDHWNILMLAMYGVDISGYTLDDSRRSVHVSVTNSRPLILHQNGEKSLDRSLEVLARAFGYPYDAAALRRSEQLGGRTHLSADAH
ncbi:hypothetical protein BC831DRAFT_463411 [Entophlyctis helioformis]|nr:hypothetical protein BC831DRAFT_463411 [Entophlyctis helioformis]